MKLDRVTITGADNSVDPARLFRLSEKYSFVEWGILISSRFSGTVPRFPTVDWIDHFREGALKRDHVKASLHVCGKWCRNLLAGVNNMHPGMEIGFQRVQLNTHGEPFEFNVTSALRTLAELASPMRQIIFQVDGAYGQAAFTAIESERPGFSIVPFFDLSHGAGVLPVSWPSSFDGDTYHGYGGGLGPENIEAQIPLIAKAAGDARFWIDMETHVRSNDNRVLDLLRVERVLAVAQQFIQP